MTGELGTKRCRDAAGVRLAIVLAAGLAALVLAAQAPARVDCTAGVRTVRGVTYRTFCGPAQAYLSIKTIDYRFDTGGRCTRSRGTFSINIGTITLGTARPKYAYFGITVRHAHVGTFRKQTVTWQLPGKRGSLIGATVKLTHGMREGQFSGRMPGGGTASGTFRC